MNSDSEELKKKIRQLNPSDFDGHTCFKDLSPEQRLDWLAELVVFVHESRSFRIKRNRGDKLKHLPGKGINRAG